MNMNNAAAQNWSRYKKARDAGHTKYVETARKFDRFYYGEQWDTKDAQKLKNQGRPALTINMIKPTINTITGEQSANRGEIQFKPRKDATQEVADTLTKLAMQISDSNSLDWVESQVFSDGLIQERGYFDIRMDFDDHVEGEIKIIALDPLDVVLDPDASEYDPSTWSDVTISRWQTLDEIAYLYGKEKAQKIRDLVGSRQDFGEDSVTFDRPSFGTLESVGFSYDYEEDEDRVIKKVRIIERQYRKLEMVNHFVNPHTGDMRVVPPESTPEQIKTFCQQYGFLTKKKLTKKIRWTVSADSVLLHDDWSPYDDFTVVPYFPYFRRGKPFGVVGDLISPQEQLNKVSSQELHVVNTTANSGWQVESGQLLNMTVESLEKRGAETGLVLERAKGTPPIEKIKPNTIPTGLDRISSKAMGNIKEISGVSDAMLGYEGAEVSGVALQAKQQRGAIQIQTPLDNLARTRHILADRMLKLIQRFYTEERVFQVIDYKDPQQGSQTLAINERTPTGEIINNITLGEYDVIISQQPARDTFDETQFAEAISLRQAGVMIPDDAVVEYSHLSRKRELADRIRQMTGQGDLTPEQQQMQQMQLEMQIKQMQLDLANLEADVRVKESQATVNMARAEDYTTDGDDKEYELAKLQLDAELKREELQNKIDLANVHIEGNKEKARNEAMTKLTIESMKPQPTRGAVNERRNEQPVRR